MFTKEEIQALVDDAVARAKDMKLPTLEEIVTADTGNQLLLYAVAFHQARTEARTASEIRPSDIVLDPIPLVGTLGRSEREVAAAMVVLACRAYWADWHPVSLDEVCMAVKAFHPEWLRNPFLKPDFGELQSEGYAVRTMDVRLMLTPRALERIAAKWTRRAA